MLTTASLAVSKQMLHSKIDSSFFSSSPAASPVEVSGVASFELPATTVGSSTAGDDGTEVDGWDSMGFEAWCVFGAVDVSVFKAGIVGSSSTSGEVDDCGMLILSDSSMLVIVTVSTTSGEDMAGTS